MIAINDRLQPADLLPDLQRMWELSAAKLVSLQETWKPEQGTPVFTVGGRYTSQGWTEWTQGFQFGSAILQFDATGDERFLELGRSNTIERMASHVTHIGVHDHGFNNVSTYGNLRRLMLEGRFPYDARSANSTNWPSKPAAPCKPLAGAGRATAMATSIPSTGRTPCFPTRSVLCVRWPWPIVWATR